MLFINWLLVQTVGVLIVVLNNHFMQMLALLISKEISSQTERCNAATVCSCKPLLMLDEAPADRRGGGTYVNISMYI